MNRTWLVFAALTLSASTLAGQDRSLHWDSIAVDAVLGPGGRLHVLERQTIVFTGDWNGGERRFDYGPRERFEFLGMRRLNADGSVATPMPQGDLSVVDGWAFTDARTLRWRSRQPGDPPFASTAITYELEYAYENVVRPQQDAFVLRHNFAFADRSGNIKRFTLRLSLDSAWQPSATFAGSWEARDLPPGEGFVVETPLQWAGQGAPEVDVGAGPVERALLALVPLLIIGSLARRLLTRERSLGRLDGLPVVDVNDAWLSEHVFVHLPEVVGAAWDNSTNATEVAAVLARFVSEGRMRSEVQPAGRFGSPVLSLELLVDRDRFHGYERQLVDALFASGDRHTDTGKIRKRYKATGFDPAEKINKPLKEMVAALVPGTKASKPSALPTFLGFVGAVLVIGVGISHEPADAPVAIILGGLTFVCYLISLGGAAAWRNRVHRVRGTAWFFVVPLGIAIAAFLGVLGSGLPVGTHALAGIALMIVALANSVLHQARSRETPDRIAFRRRLAAAREYFAAELQRPQPRMKDEWFPYLIAFGLGQNMDKWFRAFAGESAASSVGTIASHSSGSGTGNSGSGGWSGFGGGGGFSGGGASASWAAAAGSMAAGISAPSSSGSSSGGGGGGGGSSGGGGGGGW